MANISRTGQNLTYSWAFSHSIQQSLKNAGLIEDSHKTFIFTDKEGGNLIQFTGPDRKEQLAHYLESTLPQEKQPSTFEKIIMGTISVTLLGSLIVPALGALDRLRAQFNLKRATSVALSGLCVASRQNRGVCVALPILSHLGKTFASITVIKTIPDQIAYPRQNFTLPIRVSDIFYESDPSLSLSVIAKQSDGEELPAWLNFSIIPSIVGSMANPLTCGFESVYVVSNIAYAAVGSDGLKLIDVSTPNIPTILGSIATFEAFGIYVVSNIAYVADFTAGLKLIDVSDPHHPSFLGSIGINAAYKVYVVSNIAYVTAGYSLQLIDVSNPRTPTSLGSIATTSQATTGIYVVSNIAYLPAWSNLELIDVSNPRTPTILGSIATKIAQEINVVSNIAYVTDQGVGLLLIDVSNPRAPTSLGSIAITCCALDVYVVSNIAYVAAHGSYLKLIDVSNPHNPTIIGSITISHADAMQVYVVSNMAYVTGVGSEIGLGLIDVYQSAFFGKPAKEERNKQYTINLIAKNNLGETASTSFKLQVFADGPYVAHPLANQAMHIGKTFDFTVPKDTFADPYNDTLTYSSTLIGDLPLPSWLNFNTATQRFTGTTSTKEDIKSWNIGVIATDPYDTSTTAPFNLTVINSGPFVSHGLNNQTIHIGHLFDFTIPPSTFDDLDGMILSYNSTLMGGKALPDWLGFNSTYLRFTGTPLKDSDIGNWPIEVKATDPYDKRASTDFTLSTLHLGPVIVNSLSNHTLEAGHPFFLQIPANTFDNLDDVPLTYSSMLVNRKPLPSWLTFSSNLQQFNGTTQSKKDLGNLGIVVKAADAYGKSAETSFHLDIYNQGINVVGTIPDQQVFANVYFEYIFSDTIFLDEDNLPLSYRALLLNGNPLPLWLNLDSDHRTFSGTASDLDIGIHQIRLYGGDNYAEKSVDFEMIVYPFHYQSPAVKNGIPSKEASVGKYFSYKIPDDAFTSPTSDHLTYNAFLTGGNALPNWLSFAPDSKTFSGSPNGEETLSITVTVTDSYEASAQTTFTLTSINRTLRMLKNFANIGGPTISALGFLITAYVNRAAIRNHFKKKDYQAPDETITIGKPWSHTIKKVDAYHIKAIKVLVQYTAEKLSFSERVINWWNDSFVELPAQKSMPDWLTYDESNNELKNDPSKMTAKHAGFYKVIVLNKNRYEKEEFLLHVQEDGAPVLPTIVPSINSSSRDIEMSSSTTEPLLSDKEG